MSILLLNWINVTSLIYVIIIVAVLAIIFGALIVAVSKICAVKEDERENAVKERLAGANCGGCGFKGCSDYAKALVEGKAKLCDCSATSNEDKEEIAKVLGIEFTASSPVFAVVKCGGGIKAKDKFDYVGDQDCVAQANAMGGKKVCSFACLGGGTCANSCPEQGIQINDQLAHTNMALCSGCGACARNCPKGIIEIIPKSACVFVACSSNCKGKEVMSACEVGCIGCGLCAKNCPENAITMVNNLAVIDYTKCTGCKTCVAKCPRHTIKEI